MEPTEGDDPPTRCLRCSRSTNVSYMGLKLSGAGGGTRTPDPIATRDPLYRLSYTGFKFGGQRRDRTSDAHAFNVALYR